VSDVIGQLKSKTSRQLRKKFSWLEKVYWREEVVWSPGYFISSVGVDEKRIKRYVKWHGRKDSGQVKLNL
jgi:putative transposase